LEIGGPDGLIAQGLERARLYDAEFALARGLQNALLPHRLPTLTGVRVSGRYLPGTRGAWTSAATGTTPSPSVMRSR
jgi:hypothetical protein